MSFKHLMHLELKINTLDELTEIIIYACEKLWIIKKNAWKMETSNGLVTDNFETLRQAKSPDR